MGSPKIERIDQSKLRESVYDALRDAFTRGAFAPGQPVSLRMLAEQVGTSLTPVREAVRRLVAEGALLDTPSRTLQVPPFDAARMLEIKTARLALETQLLDLAFASRDSEMIDALEQVISSPPQTPGPDLKQNYDFHFLLYRASNSKVILPMVEGLWLQYGAFLNLVVREQAAMQVEEHKYHHQIVAAFRAGDLAAAQEALNEDIDRSFRFLLPDARGSAE